MNFILKMAWRDTRASRRRLLLFSLAIVLGVAALVAVGSLRDNLARAVAEQTKTLLGADLVINSRAVLTDEADRFIGSLGGEESRETSFSSMLVVPGVAATRLVQVRAVEGGFPYYGEFETEPAGARAQLAGGQVAVLEQSLLVQFSLKPGDRIRLGSADYTVAGGLLRVPGENAAFATLAPRVFIPRATVDGTGLLKPGSLARYRVYVKFPEGTDVEKLTETLRQRFRELRLGFDTVEERRKQLGDNIASVNGFMTLVGFAALFLGAIGVASAMHAHVSQKLPTVAVLRCLGASARTSFAIYLVQGLGLGLAGSLLGALLGMPAVPVLGWFIRDFLPVAFQTGISWRAVTGGIGAGVALSVLFSLWPLLEVRRISPLLTLRSAFAGPERKGLDWMRVGLAVVLLVAVFGIAAWQTGSWIWGLGFGGALFVAFTVLAVVARLVTWIVRRLPLRMLPFAWRQGFANLHRPNNRTVLLLVSLGLGTFLILTLQLSRDTILSQLRVMDAGGRPNLMLFDIQDDQAEPLTKLLAETGAPVMQRAPIVTMRISALKGQLVTDLLKEGKSTIPAWTLRREYRSTYLTELSKEETVVAGTLTRTYDAAAANGLIPVSLEEKIAKDMQVGVGDEIEFDVQGVPVKTVVGSLRKVEWRRMQPNFFVVFPAGVLEAAPKFHVMALRAASPEASARVQQAVVKDFPNVSAIDLTLILQTIDSVYTNASLVVTVLALFTVVTGVIVLAGSVLIGRHQRVRESVLLRTLGATKAQVNRVMLAEYLALGTLGAAVGAILAIGANWALAKYVFKFSGATPSLAVLAAGWAAVSAMTVITGLFSSRGICDHPPLAVLRQEG